jgi:outer membrane beta-barrel protein
MRRFSKAQSCRFSAQLLNFSLSFGALVYTSIGFAVDIPASSIDNYRLESQYGPNDALLNPLYDRNSRLEAAIGGAFNPLSSLGRYQALTGSVIYNINRRHAVEPIFYSINNTQLSSFVENQIADKPHPSGQTNAQLSVEIPKQMVMASYLFTPYHSKLHITSQSVTHFDIYFGAGVGAVQLLPINLEGDKLTSSWGALVSANAGMRFLFGGNYFTKLDFRNLIYQSEDFGKSSRKSDLQIGLSLGILL